MGRRTAEELIELLGRPAALKWHLQHNHFPAISPMMLPVAEKALLWHDADDPESWKREIRLPDGVTYKGTQYISVGDVIEQWHLDSFLE